MGPALYVIAILGCGEADTACQPVALAESRYETIEDCNRAAPAAVESNLDLAFPVVVAQCQKATQPVSHSLFPNDVAMPEAGTLPAEQPRAKPRNDVRLASARG